MTEPGKEGDRWGDRGELTEPSGGKGSPAPDGDLDGGGGQATKIGGLTEAEAGDPVGSPSPE